MREDDKELTVQELNFMTGLVIDKLIDTDAQWNLRDKAYLSFSGGKDSVIVHHLLDEALPENKIPRVFINTGIEYRAIVDFVRSLAASDSRFIILKPEQNIKDILHDYGYPFKSKQHSNILAIYQRSGYTKTVLDYMGKGNKAPSFTCPKMLLYQFTPEFNLHVSDMCCNKLKKQPASRWARQNNKTIVLTGMRKGECGQRQSQQCSAFYSKDVNLAHKGDLKKFHPIFYLPDRWEKAYIEHTGLDLCELYNPPYNFKRTGCKGCPFNIDIASDLALMQQLLPAERKQCEYIWGPVYKEYRRIRYRLQDVTDET